GGPRAQLHTQVGVPNELARAPRPWDPLDVWSVHQLQPPASRKRQEIRSEPLTLILILQIRPRVEVLLVESAHQLDVHSPDCDMVKLHWIHLSDGDPPARLALRLERTRIEIDNEVQVSRRVP